MRVRRNNFKENITRMIPNKVIKGCLVIFVVLGTVKIIFYSNHSSTSTYLVLPDSCMKSPIDVVYTWVNGSDPEFIKSRSKFQKDEKDKATNRYMDWGTLKYSLRSVKMFAPWIRNIYLVTNGQVPSWLKANSGVRIITHEQLFDGKEALLPTFNSNAIDLYLHRIPGLSDKFMFFNDDAMLGDFLKKEDLCYGYNGQKVYLGYTSIDNCMEGCANEWLGDGVCQTFCNSSTCLYDKGDCLKTGVKVERTFSRLRNDNWMKAVTMWNGIFNDEFGFDTRTYPMHQGLLFDKYVKEDFNNKFQSFVNATAHSRFRSPSDVQLHFTYMHYIIGVSKQKQVENLSVKSKYLEDPLPKRFLEISYRIIRESRYLNMVLNDNSKISELLRFHNDMEVTEILQNAKKRSPKKFFCLQDSARNLSSDQIKQVSKIITEFLETRYPLKSDFEI